LSGKAAPTRLPGILVLTGAAVVLVATFMPWLTATAPFVGTTSRNLIDGGDGQILAGVAVAAGLLGLTMLVRGPNTVMVILVALLAAVASWVIVLDYQEVSGRVANVPTAAGGFTIIAEVGPGPYLAGVGVIVWVIGGIVGFAKRNRPAATPPSTETPLSTPPAATSAAT
jgi:hypothetical protein